MATTPLSYQADDDYKDDLVGTAEIVLTPLMDGRTHMYEDVPLAMPSGPSQGTITVELRFEGTSM